MSDEGAVLSGVWSTVRQSLTLFLSVSLFVPFSVPLSVCLFACLSALLPLTMRSFVFLIFCDLKWLLKARKSIFGALNLRRVNKRK